MIDVIQTVLLGQARILFSDFDPVVPGCTGKYFCYIYPLDSWDPFHSKYSCYIFRRDAFRLLRSCRAPLVFNNIYPCVRTSDLAKFPYIYREYYRYVVEFILLVGVDLTTR